MKALISTLLVALGSVSAFAQDRQHDNAGHLAASSSDHLRIDRLELELSQMRTQIAEMTQQMSQIREALATYSGHSQNHATPPRSTASGSHTVRPGDTLSEIAQANGLSTRQLLALNPQVAPERLQIGTELRLGYGNSSSSGNRSSSSGSRRASYTVKAGDTLSEIAQSLGVSTASLIAANPSVDPRRMSVGKDLKVPQSQNASERPNTRPSNDRPSEKPAERDDASPRAPTYDRNYGEKKLVRVTQATRYMALAREYNTSVATLNSLNQVDLSSNQLIAKGSELYIPR